MMSLKLKGLIVLALIAAFCVIDPTIASAQRPSISGIFLRLADLETDVAALQSQVAPNPVLSNTIYVALNGTPAGPGTIESPYDTAQAGYDAAVVSFPGVMSTVVLMGGGPYGPLNMHAGTVHVLGHSRSEISDLTVTLGVPSPVPLPSKQRVENIVVRGPASVLPNGAGAWVKFHNCRFLDGLFIDESYVEVQDCVIQRQDLSSPAASVAVTGGAISKVGFYQSSIRSNDTSPFGARVGTLTVGAGVQDFEVIGCSIVNEDGVSGAAVLDLTPGMVPGNPLHLYSHNVIKGPATGTGYPAFAESNPLPSGPAFSFVQNTVYGDVGGVGAIALPAGSPQFFSNNTVYGIINFPALGGSPVGWAQAGAGPGLDAAGNMESPGAVAPFGPAILPSHWDD